MKLPSSYNYTIIMICQLNIKISLRHLLNARVNRGGSSLKEKDSRVTTKGNKIVIVFIDNISTLIAKKNKWLMKRFGDGYGKLTSGSGWKRNGEKGRQGIFNGVMGV